MIVCFIGHRTVNNAEQVKIKLIDAISSLIADGANTFLFGSRSEFDSLCWEAVTSLKEKYPHIKRVCYTAPHEVAFTSKEEREQCEQFFSQMVKHEVHYADYEEAVNSQKAIKANKNAYIMRNQENLYELREFPNIHVDQHRSLCIEPNIQVVVSVLLIPARLPIGKIHTHSAVEILLRFRDADALERKIEMRLNKVVCKTQPIRIDTTAVTGTVPNLAKSHIVVSRNAMDRHSLDPVKTALYFPYNFRLHRTVTLSIKRRFSCDMRHKTGFARSRRRENYSYHWLTLKP